MLMIMVMLTDATCRTRFGSGARPGSFFFDSRSTASFGLYSVMNLIAELADRSASGSWAAGSVAASARGVPLAAVPVNKIYPEHSSAPTEASQKGVVSQTDPDPFHILEAVS